MTLRNGLGALGLAMALAACGPGGQGNSAATADANQQDLTPEGPSLTAKLFGGGKPVPLSIQNAHPTGVVLQLTSVQAKASETVIGITVINSDNDEQSLNRWANQKDSYLLAASGERLYLSPPQANPELKVGAGQRMEGELVFIGRLPESGGATLILNDGSDTSSEYTTRPGFRIPIQLPETAFSDDGSKKKSAA
jgi:hypothetical protein